MQSKLLSNDALPHLASLMQHFNLALSEEMHFYEHYADAKHFAKILDYLCQDFIYFAEHLDHWQYESPNEQQQTELNHLEQYLDKARRLITEASFLLDRRQVKIQTLA